MQLNIGDLIPLELQLSDGSTVMFPQALVYDASGALLATKSLTHIAQGRYADDSLTMTNTPYTAVTYIVYSDAGHTTLAPYSITSDIWQRATFANTAIVTAILAATVEGSVTVGRAFRALIRQLVAKRTGYLTGAVAVRDLADTKTSHTLAVTTDGFIPTILDLD